MHDQSDDYGNAQQKPHKMRLSMDIHSIKDCTFKGLLVAKYGAINSLGIKPFATFPGLPIAPNNEENFKNSFNSYEFEANKNELYTLLNGTKISVELYHQDRHKTDAKIGVATLDFQKLMMAPIKQTPHSFVRVYDAYLPVDDAEVGPTNPRRIALLRVIVYLEDLGPVDYLSKNEKTSQEKIEGYLNQIPIVPPEINIQNINDDNSVDTEKVALLREMNNLEYKIIWELENWKKSEEAKFKFQLKAKEIEYLSKLDEEWRKKESDREKIFKNREAQIQQIESKLKQKANELQRREQKLIALEEELKQRITETSKQISIKEDEILTVKKRSKEEKQIIEKDKNIMTAKYEELQSKMRKLEDEYFEFKKEQENSPVNLIKNELNAKNNEIQELKKEIEKLNEIKEQYRIHFDKLKNEIIRLKKANELLKESAQKQQNSEIEQLKIKLGTLSMMEEKENLKSLQNDVAHMRHQMSGNITTNEVNPLYTKKNLAADQSQKMSKPAPKPKQKAQPTSELARLIEERDSLLSLGTYDESDPLIIELNNLIQSLQGQ